MIGPGYHLQLCKDPFLHILQTDVLPYKKILFKHAVSHG